MNVFKTVALLLAATFLASCEKQTPGGPQSATQDQPQTAVSNNPPDLVLTNGRVYTADPSNPRAEAIAILDNRIMAVGATQEILALASPETQRIDLKQHFVIPGLNDAHYHTFSNTPVGHQLELPWEPSWEQVLAAVEAAAEVVPEGTWITGLAGVDVVEDEHADRFSLDKISPNHPVYISTWFSHGEIINTAAMRLLEVDETEPDPLGGWFVRVAGSDRVTGKFHEYAQWPLRRRLVDLNLSDDELVAALRMDSERLLGFGVTSIQDMPIMEPMRYLRVLDKAELPLRVRYIRMPTTTPDRRNVDEARDVPEYPFENRLVTATGTKWFLDGTPMERGAALRQDYADRPGWRGKLSFTGPEVDEILDNAGEWKGQVLFHCEGDLCAEVVLDSMERVGNADWPGKRVRIEHGVGVIGELIPRAAKLGAIIVQQPQHLVISYIFTTRYGEQTQFFPLRSLTEAGIPLAMGTEGLESPYDAFPYAVNHPLNPNESLTREQVIDGFTSVAAFAEFEENNKGRIAEGMLADIAVLSQDLLTAPVDKLAETRSILTIVDGRIAYDAKILQ